MVLNIEVDNIPDNPKECIWYEDGACIISGTCTQDKCKFSEKQKEEEK